MAGYTSPMPPRRLIVLLLAAAVIRVMILGWDSGIYSPHPDERRVAMTTMEVRSWFDDPGFYSYGSLHFQAVRGATALLGMAPNMASLIAGGRILSLMASLLTLVLGWWMARAAWGRRTADLFLLLTMLVPLDLQQSHFATVEAHHALWVVATLAASFQLARRPSRLTTRCGWWPPWPPRSSSRGGPGRSSRWSPEPVSAPRWRSRSRRYR